MLQKLLHVVAQKLSHCNCSHISSLAQLCKFKNCSRCGSIHAFHALQSYMSRSLWYVEKAAACCHQIAQKFTDCSVNCVILIATSPSYNCAVYFSQQPLLHLWTCAQNFNLHWKCPVCWRLSLFRRCINWVLHVNGNTNLNPYKNLHT